jgi:RHS repeat-associated protein
VHEWTGGDDAAELCTWIFEPESFAPLGKIASDGTSYSIVTDYLGTPTEMFDEAGKLAWRAQLDVYGVAQVAEGTAGDCPWRWPGQYEDQETGLYYNRFRYYDPVRGSYISQDPLGVIGGPQLYSYVNNIHYSVDPYGLIDPWDIRYSQTSISDTFQHGDWAGRSLQDAIAEARDLGRLPPGLELKVQNVNGQVVALNNRTLYVAQQANLTQVHPTFAGREGDNQMRRQLGGGAPLGEGEQPEVKSKSCGH